MEPKTRHPRFYLPIDVGKAIAIGSHRKPDGRRVEVSRRRDLFEYSVICDPLSAVQMIVLIDNAAARSGDEPFRERCEASSKAICRGLAESVALVLDRASRSDRERGILGLQCLMTLA